MTIRKFQSPLVGLKRFASDREIRMNIGGEWRSFSFNHIRDLITDLSEMVDGNLVEVDVMDCGCVNRKFSDHEDNRHDN